MHLEDNISSWLKFIRVPLLALVLVLSLIYFPIIHSEEPLDYSDSSVIENLSNSNNKNNTNSTNDCDLCASSLPFYIRNQLDLGKKIRVKIRLRDNSTTQELNNFKSYLISTDFELVLDYSDRGFLYGVIDKKIFNEIKDFSIIKEFSVDNRFSVFLNESLPMISYNQTFEEFNLTGKNITIAVLDTGANLDFINYSVGYDFIDNDSIPEDNNGHGTKVTSIIDSIAPDSELVIAKVINDNGTGYESTVIEGLSWCLEQDPDIVSFSIGTSCGCSGFCDSNLLAEMCNQAFRDGVFVVASSGNDGSSSIVVPACGSNVFSVGATDDEDNIADFSNVNPTLDCFAPGVDITTETGTSSGTSMSCPHVAGAAALVLEHESLTPGELKNRFRSTGKPVFYEYNESLTLNISRLDVYNAVINNQTMRPYNYSGWWQDKLKDQNYSTLGTVTYYFDDRDTDLGAEEWTTNPGNMIDGRTDTNAETTTDQDVQLLDGNTCSADSLGTIDWVHLRAYGDYDGSCINIGIMLQPVFGDGDGDLHDAGIGSSPGWGSWVDITNDTNSGTWNWLSVDNLDCDVMAVMQMCGGGTPKVKCAKVEIKVGYTSPPETTIDDIPDTASNSDVSTITGGSSDEDGTIAGVYLKLLNTTDSTEWCGSQWSESCAGGDMICAMTLTASAEDESFDSNNENWVYDCDNAGVTWGDGKNYTVSAKAKDNEGNCDSIAATDTFTFSSNQAPDIDETSESPTNGSTGVSTTPRCSITVNDPNSDNMMIQFWENSTGSWTRRQTNESVGNGTYKWDFTQASSGNTKYWWRVRARDLYQNVTPDSNRDPDGAWSSETNAYDDNTGTYASGGGTEAWLYFNLTEPIECSAVKIYGAGNPGGKETELIIGSLEVYDGSSWTTICQEALYPNTWTTIENVAEDATVESARIWCDNREFTQAIKEFRFVETDENVSTYHFTTKSSDQSYKPVITNYDLKNSTGSKLSNDTGSIDNEKEYYFIVNVTDDNGWEDINYINISAWYDNGNDATSYNQTEGENINLFLQYKNTTGTEEFNLLWPNDEVKIINTNCSETIINSTTRTIKISFKPKGQMRWADSNNSWNKADNTTDDPFSWNFKIEATDNSSLTEWKKDEFGVSRYTNITTDQSELSLTVAPGYSGETNIITITFQSNYDYKLKVYFEKNLTNSTTGNKIDIKDNLYILAETDPNDDITTDQVFAGIGEKHAIEIINNSGSFSKNNSSQTIQSQYQVHIPLGTPSGIYSSRIATEITQK